MKNKILDILRNDKPYLELIELQEKGEMEELCPEISELDINPLMAHENKIIAVDARIKIEK